MIFDINLGSMGLACSLVIRFPAREPGDDKIVDILLLLLFSRKDEFPLFFRPKRGKNFPLLAGFYDNFLLRLNLDFQLGKPLFTFPDFARKPVDIEIKPIQFLVIRMLHLLQRQLIHCFAIFEAQIIAMAEFGLMPIVQPEQFLLFLLFYIFPMPQQCFQAEEESGQMIIPS
jgi:hypothetical protein